MNTDRQMIEDLLSALEYHQEQTRPIHFTTTAIQAAREHLRTALAEQPAEQEPVYFEVRCEAHPEWMWVDHEQFAEYTGYGWQGRKLYTAPQPAKPVEREPWTPREIELIDGMIEVQLNHAERCDHIANRTMAEKQKGWDMERVALLSKIRGTPPQPAKRKPLTQQEVVDGFCKTPHQVQYVAVFDAGVRFAERAHGIGSE